jgi:hypothetical protein
MSYGKKAGDSGDSADLVSAVGEPVNRKDDESVFGQNLLLATPSGRFALSRNHVGEVRGMLSQRMAYGIRWTRRCTSRTE